MKVFITKYALTSGIEEYNFPKEAFKAGRINYIANDPHWRHHVYVNDEWFADRNDAVVNANDRLARKITSVEKQLAKLRKMEFE